MTTSYEGIFEKYPTAEFDVNGQVVAFPVARIEEEHVNRLVHHERIYRPGARLDDTNSKAKVWRLTVEAYNSKWHEGDVRGEYLYPDDLNKLLDLFDEHETGDLVVPTRGKRRCRAERYTRIEEAGERDFAVVVLTFVEDNEDDAGAAAFQAPSAKSVVVTKANDAARASEDQSPMDPDAATMLRENAAALESYANAPFDYAGDIEAQVSSITSAVDKMEGTFAKRQEEAEDELYTLLTDPAASRAGRLLREVSDTASRVLGDKLSEGPDIVTRVLGRDVTLFGLAVTEGMDADRLLELNPGLDPFNVPAGTPISVEE